MKKVCVIGLGYIGLPTAALLANRGYQVVGVDVKQDVVDIINKGEIHIVEPDLDGYVQKAVRSGMLKASLKPEQADIFIIAVPTPFKNNYQPNIDYVLSATESLLPVLQKGNIVILESTSPVGTTQIISEILEKAGFKEEDVFLAHCPERVLPGKIMYELVENDRIVGGVTPLSAETVASFYNSFISGAVYATDDKTAELCKLIENSYRDVNIAFANELSLICKQANINVWNVIELANKHPRVNILKPGCGVGGHCIAVDPWFIVSAFPEQTKLIKTARNVNDYKSEWVVNDVRSSIEEFKAKYQTDPKVALMGLAFKPDIDDMREAPAFKIASKLVQNNDAQYLICEPNIKHSASFNLIDCEEAIEKADMVIFLVAHTVFKKALPTDKIVKDYCGVTN